MYVKTFSSSRWLTGKIVFCLPRPSQPTCALGTVKWTEINKVASSSSMPLNLKIAWGAGGSSVRMMGLADELNLGDFKKLIANKSGIDPSRMQLKAGFPPKNVLGSETDLVVQLGITSGSAVTVLEQDVTPPAQATSQPRPSTPAPKSTSSARPNPPKPIPPPVTPPTHNTLSNETVKMLVDMGFPREYAKRALEVAGGDINTALEICMGGDPSAFMAEDAGAAAAASAPAAPAKIMVRRIVDADNSCLFNSVGYVLRRKRKVGSELRRMITDAVRGNPHVYNEGILGKHPEDYCAWIADSKSWGGEIELSILSKKLSVMITVVDIQTNNAYSYGEADGHDRRVFVIYNGIHYDALAEAVSESTPEVDDVTTFHPEDTEKLRMAKEVAADLKSRNQFTNMGNADLKCMVCLKLFEGEKGALEHARATGHQNFGQV